VTEQPLYESDLVRVQDHFHDLLFRLHTGIERANEVVNKEKDVVGALSFDGRLHFRRRHEVARVLVVVAVLTVGHHGETLGCALVPQSLLLCLDGLDVV
jgi:hypothetical protein